MFPERRLGLGTRTGASSVGLPFSGGGGGDSFRDLAVARGEESFNRQLRFHRDRGFPTEWKVVSFIQLALLFFSPKGGKNE